MPIPVKRERAISTTLSLPADVEQALTDRALEERVPRSVVAVRLLKWALVNELTGGRAKQGRPIAPRG